MDLYHITISPPCWSVLVLGRQLDLTFNLKEVDYVGGAHMKEDYLKINPAHTVPTLVVGDDYSLSESRAIMVYLMESYTAAGGDSHPLYPRDAKTRGLIHNRLDFDLGTLYQRFYTYCSPLWDSGSLGGTEKNREKVHEAFRFLEAFLSKTRYAAADHLTIADISLVASVTALDFCNFDRSKYAKVSAWYDTCKKELIGFEDLIAQVIPVWQKFIINPAQN